MGDGITHGEYGWQKQKMIGQKEDQEEHPIPSCLGGPRKTLTIKEMRELKMLAKSVKDTNPKDAVGVRKAPISTVSHGVMAELGIAMLEGGRKYGRHNYRIKGVRASVYHDAAWRHLMSWWDFGQDIDPDSGLSHITKAIASLMVLRDAMMMNNWTDDRPPPLPKELLALLNKMASELIDKYPDPKDPYTKVEEDAKRQQDDNC